MGLFKQGPGWYVKYLTKEMKELYPGHIFDGWFRDVDILESIRRNDGHYILIWPKEKSRLERIISESESI